MNDRNPLEIKKKIRLKTGCRLGSKKSNIKYKRTSIVLKESHYKKILNMINKNGSLTLTKIINDCLDNNLDKIKKK